MMRQGICPTHHNHSCPVPHNLEWTGQRELSSMRRMVQRIDSLPPHRKVNQETGPWTVSRILFYIWPFTVSCGKGIYNSWLTVRSACDKEAVNLLPQAVNRGTVSQQLVHHQLNFHRFNWCALRSNPSGGGRIGWMAARKKCVIRHSNRRGQEMSSPTCPFNQDKLDISCIRLHAIFCPLDKCMKTMPTLLQLIGRFRSINVGM